MGTRNMKNQAVEAEQAVEAVGAAEAAVAAADPLKGDTVNAAAEAAKEHFRKMRELVAVTPAAPRAGEDPNYPIGVNGKMWILPKGKTSMVPKYVAMAFEQAEAAKGTQLDNQAKLLEQRSGNTLDLSTLTQEQIAQLKALLGIG